MLAVQDCKASFATQMEIVHIDFSLMKQDMPNFWERTRAAKERIGSLEETLQPLSTTMRTATDKLVILRAKIDHLENCS